MFVFARGIEHPLDVPIERSQHSNVRGVRKSRPSAAPIRQPNRGPPFLLLGLGKLHDVGGDVLKGDKLATAGQGNRIVEWPFPAALSH
jgi:hypothetical protein